jgi:hypothetical protein
MLGHGTGTLSILAGKDLDGQSFGAAGNLDIVPVRVASSPPPATISATCRRASPSIRPASTASSPRAA